MKIGIIGCGNLGLSLIKGMQQLASIQTIYASKRDLNTLGDQSFKNTVFTADNSEVIKNSEIIIIALKPFNVQSFLMENKEYFKKDQHTIVSVATGITCSEMQQALDQKIDLFRAMPNTATSVNESITAISIANDTLGRREEIELIFNSLGETVIIEEHLMESATILGACGIAYVLRFMRAMIQGGIEVGFDAKTATKIVSQTVKGAAELIIQNGSHPEEEIDKVTTPKGCTIVGLNEMEHSGFSSALIKGIVASYEKIER